MKKIIIAMMLMVACLSFNNEAKAETKSINLVNEYTWTGVNRPDVLQLRVIDSNNGNIKRELTWVDTWEGEDTDSRILSFQLLSVLFCDGDTIELTNISNHQTHSDKLNYHELWSCWLTGE